MPHRHAGIAVAAAAAIVVLLAGCGGAPTPSPTPTPTLTPSGDGVLRIGTLFPSSGGTSFIGPAQVAGVNAAVREINAAGGVNGAPVEVINRDSGDASSSTAEASFADLVAKGADVVIGPSSSVLAQRLLAPAAEAGVPLISPAATYPQLTALDADGIFFRTIASSPHQAAVLAERFASAGDDSVAIVYTDDVLGDALAVAFQGLADSDAVHVTEIEVAADADLAGIVSQAREALSDVVVLATPDNGDRTKALITQLSAAGLGGAKLWLTSQNVADYSQSLPAGLLSGVNGLLDGAAPDAAFAAKVKQEDPGLADLHYAAEAYDATILAALAATLAHDDGGRSITAMLRAASVDGIKCGSYGECLDVLATQPDIDYDGVSGAVNLDDAGDPVHGTFQIVTYSGENKWAVAATAVG